VPVFLLNFRNKSDCTLSVTTMLILFTFLLMTMSNPADCQEITVTGGIIFHGNEPFAIPVLYDDNDKRYFLNVTEDIRREMAQHAGKKVKVTGRLYKDDILDEKNLFIKVSSYEWIEHDL
jgi:hypothetical protein